MRRIGVAALLVAPPAVVAVLAWPDPEPDPGLEAVDPDLDGGPLALGDDLDGELAFNGVAAYDVVGTGRDVVVGVRGDGIDTTLTALDVETGEQLGYIDDANGSLDPELALSLDDGQAVRVEVRELGGRPGTYSIHLDGP
ncbi:MAG: hypothetical protein H0W25_07035 [Acidimicrobiia bacterium]|nr:hypothetical protein [Acidimicrobiia bacterium]